MPRPNKRVKTNPHHQQQYSSGQHGHGHVPQRKRQKYQQSLTQEEIWDDSALIRSWDEAVAEYEVCISASQVSGFLSRRASCAREFCSISTLR